jgi:hypothetical protein
MIKHIRFLSISTIILFFPLFSCEKDAVNKYNVSNPTEEIEWLKAGINSTKQNEYSYYVMADFKGETVFYYGNCDPAANYVSFIKNSNGDTLGFTNDLIDQLTDIKIIWKHENSKCDF